MIGTMEITRHLTKINQKRLGTKRKRLPMKYCVQPEMKETR